MITAQKQTNKAFTLIELLVVLAILAVLIVTALIALNPTEGQRKSRDVKRLKDVSTLTAIIEQNITDGKAAFCIAAAGCSSSGAGNNVASQPCTSNWLGVDQCKYANTVPADPSNNVSRTTITGGTVATPTTGSQSTVYRVKMVDEKYEINVVQEASANANNVLSDGGNSTKWAEYGNDLTLLAD